MKTKTLAQAIAASIASFNAQKKLPKAEVMKLVPGTWVEIAWRDSRNQVYLLLEKPKRERGEVSLLLLSEKDGVNRFADSGQVVAVHGTVAWPKVETQ